MKRFASSLGWLACCLAAGSGLAAEEVDYVRDVKPIFKERCYACHGSLKQEGGLRVDTVALMLKGGYSGPALEAGDAESSYLLERILDTDESSRMPQEGVPVPPEEIAKISRWIEAGAKAPQDDKPEADPREHWAFKRPVRPEVPDAVSERAGVRIRNPIDRFIVAEHAKRGLRGAEEADKASLLRRIYLDLIGLPPTREDLHAFLADQTPDAYEKVVDRLLDSPQYGERWGRHWMDVWRYSDWYGRRNANDVTNSYPMIWRWRDWIVRSLNEDKGYDRMIVEMLAADEVVPEEDENIVATGYLVRNCFRWNTNQWMKDNVEHVGKAFLGLTMNCAHCHDHKYDPITQEEYFAFRAFFEPLELRQDRWPGSPDPGPYKKYVYLEKCEPILGGMIRVFDEKLDAETLMYARGDERSIMEGRPPVDPRLPDVLGLESAKITPVALPPSTIYPGLKPFIADEELAEARAAVSRAKAQVGTAKDNRITIEPALVEKVKDAQSRLTKLEEGHPEIASEALSGKASLFLEALKGRRTLANSVTALGPPRDGTTVSFQIKLLADGHANFQLTLNNTTGATAAFIGFEEGRIVSFRPDAYKIVNIGRYNLLTENQFQVTGIVDVAKDQLRWTVKTVHDRKALVENAATALHGWDPTRPDHGILVDARPGTVVVFDEIELSHPNNEPAVRFDFESPTYALSEDAAGRHGWKALPVCVAPAASMVSAQLTPSAAIVGARRELAMAARALDALRLAVTAAETAFVAAEKDLASLKARIAAGKAKFENAENASLLAREASRIERAATHAKAVAEEQAAERMLAEIESKPSEDSQRVQAKKRCDTAHRAVVAAVEALVEDSEKFTFLTPTYPAQSTGRRTALAKAITSRDNPLTARVAVNHIWMRHFGRPIVESVFDFGRNGKPPTHPELLDWLAVEFMDSGWSMKKLHRLIVTSGTYRMTSKAEANSPNGKLDPDHQFLARFPRQRMEAEVVRDSVLHTAGELDLTMGGQEIEQAEQTRRRSIYISHHGEGRAVMLETFNAANPTDCYRRIETVVPQQALAVANSELTAQASRILARNLWQTITSDDEMSDEQRNSAFVHAAYEQLLTRGPRPEELIASLDLMQRQIETYRTATSLQQPPSKPSSARTTCDAVLPSSDPAMRARESLVHALYSHHDFISVR